MITDKQNLAIDDGIASSLSDALKDNPNLARLNEIKSIVNFYKKSKKGEIRPAQIIAKINKYLLSNLQNKYVKHFVKVLEEKLSDITIRQTENGLELSYTVPDYEVKLEIELIINGTQTAIATVVLGVLITTDVTALLSKSNKGKVSEIEANMEVFFTSKMILGSKKILIASPKVKIKGLDSDSHA